MRVLHDVLILMERLERGLHHQILNYGYRLLFKEIGIHCRFCSGLQVFGFENISIGNRVTINEGCILQAGKDVGIRIGDDVTLSYSSMILTSRLDLEMGRSDKEHRCESVTIENWVWIGARAIIQPGVHIGEGAVVAAGAVVTHDILPWTLVAGNPAREMKKLPHIPGGGKR